MTSYHPEHRGLAFALALTLALAGAALTVWLGTTGGRALLDLARREGVQLSPIPGLLFVVASLFLLLARRRERPAPLLRAAAAAAALAALAILFVPFLID